MQSQLITVEFLHNEFLQLLPLEIENQKRLDKKFRLEFSYNSNHIEGNTLTYGETELLILFDDTKGNHTLREFEEMKSHDIAFLKINDWAKEDRDLTETDIKELNRIILVRDFWKEAITEDHQPTRRKIIVGNYKQHPNSVRLENGEMFDYASVTDTPILMRELIDWYKTEGKDFHPVVLAAIFHYKFVRIHPFDDGNGRVARLLLNYILLKNNFPPIVIKSNDKKNYLSALHKADLGDLEAFSKYILEQQIWSLELSIKAAKGENIDEPNDWEKKLAQMKISNNQLKDSTLKLKLSRQSFNDFSKNSIVPLLEKTQEVLFRFEIMFKNSSFKLHGFHPTEDIFDTSHLFKKEKPHYDLLTLYEDFFLKYDTYSTPTLKFSFQFNFDKNDTSMSDIELFDIEINTNRICVKNKSSEINKFYNETLSEKEISEIVNSIATDLIQKIEEAQQ